MTYNRIFLFGIINVLAMSSMLLLSSCSLSSSASSNDKKIVSSNQAMASDDHVSEIYSSMEQSGETNVSVGDIDEVAPSFKEILEVGTYRNPIHINGSDKDYTIELSEKGFLRIPDSSIFAVDYQKWGDDQKLFPCDEKIIKSMIFQLRKSQVTSGSGDEKLGAGDQDTSVTVVLMTNRKMYAAIEMDSYKDDTIQINVNREEIMDSVIQSGQPAIEVYMAHSSSLHELLREICNVRSADKHTFANADQVQYLDSNHNWKTMTADQLQQMKKILSEAKEERNYAYGCPFDMKLRIHANDKTYTGAVATDSCGLIIIEDTTYEAKTEEQKLQLRTLFPEVNWDGGATSK